MRLRLAFLRLASLRVRKRAACLHRRERAGGPPRCRRARVLLLLPLLLRLLLLLLLLHENLAGEAALSLLRCTRLLPGRRRDGSNVRLAERGGILRRCKGAGGPRHQRISAE